MANEVATLHHEYKEALPSWERCRIAAEGQRAVHKAGEKFLPRLSGQSDEEYEGYKKRALFYNATGRTVDGLSGLVFRKQPVFNIPSMLEYMTQNVDTAGTPLMTFCEEVVEELLVVGRIGLLADYPKTDVVGTMADQIASGAKPYVSMYKAEKIINWRLGNVNGKVQLTLVVLAEKHHVPTEFGSEDTPQLRVLRLTNGVYNIQLWREQKNDKGVSEWRPVSEPTVPVMNSKPLDYIPFVVCGPRGVEIDPEKSPIEDLVDVNLSHYMTTADYEHGLHFTGLPTPIVTGHMFADNEEFKLGSTTVKAFSNPDAKASFLEFQGKGLDQLSKRLTEKENMMATLGARLLAAEKRSVESAETASIHRSGENGVLASLAMASSSAISVVLTWCAGWAGTEDEFTAKLNTDYMPSGMTPQELSELVKSWQSGAISYETLYDNLQRGEIARQNVTSKDERDLINMEAPTGITSADPLTGV